jgi:1,2-dihydroxy-3-keto-5-methylthiopentene dioxygenase
MGYLFTSFTVCTAMATLSIPSENRQITDPEAVRAYLADLGIRFERWESAHPLAEDADADAVLTAYAAEIDTLKTQGGYVTADVIDIKPDTPNLDAMLDKFNKEHWHDEDEVRFILAGHGLFHINPGADRPVVAVEVGPGDLLCVPKGTQHWFDLCHDRRVRAIRLFQDPAGLAPHYTDSGKEKALQPLCFGPSLVTA